MAYSHCSLVILVIAFLQVQVEVCGQEGVTLSLNGVAIANDSYVDVDDIGGGYNHHDGALLCHTDKPDCCSGSNRAGDWYFPDMTLVESFTVNRNSMRTSYFSRNRGDSVVRLWRYGTPSERGLFYCQVPNANNMEETIYVNLVNILSDVVISSSIQEIAGTSTTSQCSIDIELPDENVSPPTFEWFFGPNNNSLPSGVMEPVMTNSGNNYTSTIHFSPLLPSHAGQYTCQLRGNQQLSANTSISVYTDVAIITPVNPTVIEGEKFSLKCSAYYTALPSIPAINWFFGPINSSLPIGVTVSPTTSNGNGYSSTLQFSPLRMFHAGVYTCRVGNNQTFAASIVLTVDPEPSADVSSTGTPRAGETYSLLCALHGSHHPQSAFSYEWTKNNDTTQNRVGTNSNTLSFSPLKLSDAGQYICEVTVGNRMYGAIEYISVQILPPLSVVVTSNKANPIRPIGSNITLTCRVWLSPAVDVPVTVNIQLIDPTGQLLTASTPLMDGSTYTSTSNISSFGRSKSGDYTCTSSVMSSLSYLINSGTKSATLQLMLGVYLSLKGSVYSNNSIIFVNEIGETNASPMAPHTPQNGLQCITDRMPCCSNPNRLGEWLYPNGTVVPGSEHAGQSAFYSSRGLGNDGTVSLNRIGLDSNISTGRFCCVLPDINDVSQTLCAVIDIVTVAITPSGVNTAGENYSLECTINGFAATFQWIDEKGVLIVSQGSRRIVSVSPSSSQLQLAPLHQTHGGNYTCTANVSGTMESKSIAVHVRAPIINISITDGGIAPNVEQSYVMTCRVYGAENLNATIEYEWRDHSSMLIGHSNNHTFTSLGLSDAGLYTCKATITSSYLTERINTTASHNVTIQIPSPASVAISSDHVNPVRPVGSNVTLTCTVELSPSVDVSVTVNIMISGPDGLTLSSTSPRPVIVGNSRAYVSTAHIASFGRDHSGWYMCEAKNVKRTSQFLTDSETITERKHVTVGVYLLLKGTVYANNSIIAIDEIGEVTGESNNGLQCVTDSKQCCQGGSQAGAWHLPSGDAVPSQGNDNAFYTSRGNGTVILNHIHQSNTTPTSGVFCCEIPNASFITQTICSILIPTVTVEVSASGSASIGMKGYSLTCSLSGADNLDATVSYQWTKHNGTRTQLGSNTNRLSFPSLRLSDAGEYACVAFVSLPYLQHPINATSRPFPIQLEVPQPVVRLVSDTPNTILSGSSPTLTCAVELDPAVDVPVSVATEWTGPDGSMLASATPPAMRSLTHYTSKAKLNYVESADSGTYTCSVSIDGKTSASVEKEIVIGDGMFQLQLIICQPWLKNLYSDEGTELYKYHIEEALIEAIESRCECHFPKQNLFTAMFSCAGSLNMTTYRNTLIGTYNFNSTQLIDFIQDWVSSGPRINIKSYAVKINSRCHVGIASMNEPECGN